MRKDSYGFPVARPKGIEMQQEYPRYLRAVIETSRPDQQAVTLVEAWRRLRAGIWDADEITITGILRCRTQPLDGLEGILLELMPLLREGEDIQDDRWLREAVRLRHGKSGLFERIGTGAWPGA